VYIWTAAIIFLFEVMDRWSGYFSIQGAKERNKRTEGQQLEPKVYFKSNAREMLFLRSAAMV
jgi:hypothetical protein